MTPAMMLRINEVFAQLTEGATPSDSNIVYVSLRHGYLVGHADAVEPAETAKTIVTELDDDDPLWLVNEQIKGLLEGDGADEDHQDVLTFLRATGLPEDTINRMHKAIVCAEVKK